MNIHNENQICFFHCFFPYGFFFHMGFFFPRAVLLLLLSNNNFFFNFQILSCAFSDAEPGRELR